MIDICKCGHKIEEHIAIHSGYSCICQVCDCKDFNPSTPTNIIPVELNKRQNILDSD